MPATFIPQMPRKQDQLLREVQDTIEHAHEAFLDGNIPAVADVHDFPVLFVTDTSKGEGIADLWDRNQYHHYHAVMHDALSPQVVEALAKAEREFEWHFITDAIVVVIRTDTAHFEGETKQWKSFGVLMKNDGKWKVKAHGEGGWGDRALAELDEYKKRSSIRRR